MLHKFALPVTHEFGCYFHVTDLDFYYAVVSYYSDHVTDRYNHHIRLGDRVFKFWSKQGGLYNTNFSVCNIKTEFHHSVKSYRITNFLDRRPEDPLRHPKLEGLLKFLWKVIIRGFTLFKLVGLNKIKSSFSAKQMFISGLPIYIFG